LPTIPVSRRIAACGGAASMDFHCPVTIICNLIAAIQIAIVQRSIAHQMETEPRLQGGNQLGCE
jgi:hypothetical protein